MPHESVTLRGEKVRPLLKHKVGDEVRLSLIGKVVHVGLGKMPGEKEEKYECEHEYEHESEHEYEPHISIEISAINEGRGRKTLDQVLNKAEEEE